MLFPPPAYGHLLLERRKNTLAIPKSKTTAKHFTSSVLWFLISRKNGQVIFCVIADGIMGLKSEIVVL